MINYTPQSQISLTLFKTPFQQSLNPENRWVILKKLLPWDRMVVKPLMKVMSSKTGRGSINLRYVLGALLIKGLENLSDEDTILAIQENIYMQYFIGLPEFVTEPVFVPEVLVGVRKRLGKEGMKQINDIVIEYSHQSGLLQHRKEYTKKDNQEDNKKDSDTGKTKALDQENDPDRQSPSDQTENRGTLKLDATVADQYIRYPVDTSLLAEARLASEDIIDRIYSLGVWGNLKPRTYRNNAKDDYLDFAKKKKPGRKLIRKAAKKQLNYIARNLGYIEEGLDMLSEDQYKEVFKKANSLREYFVIQEVYRQQTELLQKRGSKYESNSVEDRIVSFHQPWVRPIVRGKAGRRTEFGAKVNFSETEGFIRADRIDFNNFNESTGLKDQVEAYYSLYGYYPASVLVDKIYLTRENRKYLDSKNIKHYGAPLGRPPKMSKQEKLTRKKKQNKRSEVEAIFGLGKIKFGLNKIMMKSIETSKGQIHLIALSINIWQMVRNIFAPKLKIWDHLWLRISQTRKLVDRWVSWANFSNPQFKLIHLNPSKAWSVC